VTTTAATGEKSFVTALLLCLFLGWFGAHRFYVGKVRTGILMLLTFGGLCVWQLIDVVMIANGNVRDDKGMALVR
jgi:TM2 domain-containing membrane protein YozV